MNLYEATYEDSESKTFNCKVRSDSDAHAKELGQAIATKSDAQWIGIKKISSIALPVMDTSGAQPVNITPNALGTPGTGSDVQSKCKFVYTTNTPNEFASFELPAPKSTLVTRRNRNTSTDPLASIGTDKLRSVKDKAALALREGHYDKRVRRL